MAASTVQIDTKTFLDMYDRLGTNVQYFVLSKVHDNANLFTKNIFHFHMEDYTFEFKRLLKKPVSKPNVSGSVPKTKSGSSASPVPLKKVRLATEEENELDTDSDEFRDALEKLNAALKEENLNALKDLATKENEHLPEDRIIVCLGNHLIASLAGKAVTSKTKSKLSCPCTSKCGKRLQAEERMYIGSDATWHGELDLLARGMKEPNSVVGIVAARNIEKVEGDADMHDISDDEGSLDSNQGKCTNLEYKKHEEPSDKCEAISQSIVFGWTEFNRHKDLNPYIPSIYIDQEKFLFFIYNSELDSLISSANYINFFYEKISSDLPKADKYSGIFILWIILNHRLFFRRKIQGGFHLECGFTKQLSKESLQAYQELKDYEVFVQDKEKDYDQWGHEPQMKRRMPDETLSCAY